MNTQKNNPVPQVVRFHSRSASRWDLWLVALVVVLNLVTGGQP